MGVCNRTVFPVPFFVGTQALLRTVGVEQVQLSIECGCTVDFGFFSAVDCCQLFIRIVSPAGRNRDADAVITDLKQLADIRHNSVITGFIVIGNSRIHHSIIRIHTVGIGVVDIEAYKIIIGAIITYNNFKILISRFTYRVCTNIRKGNFGINKGK